MYVLVDIALMSSAARFSAATRSGPAGRLGRLVSAGHIVGGRGVPGPRPRAFEAYAVMLVYRGAGVYRDADGERPLRPGSLVLVRPRRAHWYGVVGPGTWNEVYLTFEGLVFDTASRSGLLPATEPVLTVDPVPYWVNRIDTFRTRRAPATATAVDREACDVLRLLVDLAGRGGSEPVGGGWLHRSQAALTENLSEQVAMPAVAAAVGMGYETWRKRFQAETGLSPARYRLLRRVDAAAEALRRSTLSHREIAASLGFSDEHHLSKVFRAVRGVTPSQFRREGC